MKIHLDTERCTGHGRCYTLVPELFEPDEEDGHAKLLQAEVGPEQEERARTAVANCPERAISVD